MGKTYKKISSQKSPLIKKKLRPKRVVSFKGGDKLPPSKENDWWEDLEEDNFEKFTKKK